MNITLRQLYGFFNDEKARTCKTCGAIHPGKKPPAGWGLDALKA